MLPNSLVRGDLHQAGSKNRRGLGLRLQPYFVNIFILLRQIYGRGPNWTPVHNRALYLPKAWASDPARLAATHVPTGTMFATKPALAVLVNHDAFAYRLGRPDNDKAEGASSTGS